MQTDSGLIQSVLTLERQNAYRDCRKRDGAAISVLAATNDVNVITWSAKVDRTYVSYDVSHVCDYIRYICTIFIIYAHTHVYVHTHMYHSKHMPHMCNYNRYV